MAEHRFDVVVVGAGPAGSTVAWLLTRFGLSVMMADRGLAGPRLPEVLAPPAVPALAALDLLSILESEPRLATPCLGIRRLWGERAEVHDFMLDVGGRGFIVDRGELDAVLVRRAELAGAACWKHAVLKGIEGTAGDWRLGFAHGTRLRTARARFVIDASGRTRAVARRLGVRLVRTSTLIARWHPDGTPSTKQTPSRWVDVAAADDGWSYGLRGPAGRFVCVNLGIDSRPGSDATREGRVVPAGGQILERCAGNGWVAVGDAAASFDPIASQGLSHALGSALALAPTVLAALDGNGDERLLAYDRAVKATFSYSDAGARQVYAAARARLSGAFWRRMNAPRQWMSDSRRTENQPGRPSREDSTRGSADC